MLPTFLHWVDIADRRCKRAVLQRIAFLLHNTSRKIISVAALGVALNACSGAGSETRTAPELGPEPSKDPVKAFACNWTRQLARTCFEEATSTVACEEVPRQIMVQPAGTKPPPPEVQAHFDDICIFGCQAKQKGMQWKAVLAAITCIQ